MMQKYKKKTQFCLIIGLPGAESLEEKSLAAMAEI